MNALKPVSTPQTATKLSEAYLLLSKIVGQVPQLVIVSCVERPEDELPL